MIILFIITSDVYEQECQKNLSNTHRLTRTDRMQRLTMEQKNHRSQEILAAVRKEYGGTTARCWFKNRQVRSYIMIITIIVIMIMIMSIC